MASATDRRVLVRSPDTNGPSSSVWGDDTVLVFDAHGVVLNRAFPTFVHRRAAERGDDPRRVWRRWRRNIRLDCWEGRLAVEDAWHRLFPGDDPAALDRGLAASYAPGPIFDLVANSDRRAWLLSNHRTEWLLPQLERFGLEHRFERVLVSDVLGVAKPDRKVFRVLRRLAGDRPTVLFDDSARNVSTARHVGLEAYQIIDPTSTSILQGEPNECYETSTFRSLRSIDDVT